MSVLGRVFNHNRTGVSQDPDRAKDMMRAAKAMMNGTSDAEFHAHRRLAPTGTSPVATMPPPAHPEKAGSATLLDKLGERLAFERAGVRLYDALLLKLDAQGSYPGGPLREDLERIRDEELSHFAMLAPVIGRFGGDPTSVTPGANLAAVETKGVMAVIQDARTTLAEGLHAMLVAELVDECAWTQLVDLLENLNELELAEAFGEALRAEERHLEVVKGWLAADTTVRLADEADVLVATDRQG